MGDQARNNTEDMSAYEKSAVRLPCLGLKGLILGLVPPGSELVPATSGMIN
jgi:hypothetical protein